MRTTKYIGLMMMTAAFSTALSCSDYSDWNTVQSDTTPNTGKAAEQTLWENLIEQEQLSDFVSVLKKVDLSETFNATQFYTVWAPINGTFDLDSVMNCTDEDILAQFVNNHIAQYNHQALGSIDTKVKTLNHKAYEFKWEDGAYTFNGVGLAKTSDNMPLYNLPNKNGTLHMIDGSSLFLPNGLEALTMIDGIGTISDYIMQYNDTALDKENSVPGSIVGGMQTYLDSVFTISNTMTNQLRAKIESEDSTYTILYPTDKAYNDYYQTVKPLYKYLDGMKWQDVAGSQSTTYTETDITSSLIGVDFTFLSDSLAKRAVINNLFYSNNNRYNMHLAREDAENYNDTVVTTTRTKLSNGNELFNEEYIVHTEQLSNGTAYVVDTLAFKPWETHNEPITIYGTEKCRVINYASSSNVRLAEENTNTALVDIADGNLVSYCWAQATDRGKPEVDFYLAGVQATTYNIYCVIPPANVDSRDTLTAVRPNILNFSYNGYYVDAAGKTQHTGNSRDLTFTNERYDGESIVQGSTTLLQATDFVNDTSKVDTLYLGQITFPYSYRGLGYYPNIKVTSSARINVLRPDILANYTRDIRICALLLRPLDYEEYLLEEKKKNPKDE